MNSASYVLDQPLSTRVEELVDGDVTTTYVGYAAPGALEANPAWSVRKIVSNSATKTTSVTFAGGSPLYKKTWSDRATHSYS